MRDSFKLIDKATFFGALALLLAVTLPLVIFPEQGAAWVGLARSFVVDNLGFLYLALGFGHAAQTVVDMVPKQPRNPARQTLAARVALALGRPALAQASLLGLESKEADVLRAKSKAMSGAHDEAYRLYEQANEPENAARTAWLAKDWQSLTSDDTPLFGPVAMLSSNPIEVDSAYDGMLARTNTALEESSSARQLLAELLRTPDLQISGAQPFE